MSRAAGDLEDTPRHPLDAVAHDQLVPLGKPARAVTMNCRGKHGGMLATCVHKGWAHDTTTYHEPEHPLQRRITDTIAELTDEPPAHIGVDVRAVAPLVRQPDLGRRRPVGHVRAVLA